jgi:hypothetical protein
MILWTLANGKQAVSQCSVKLDDDGVQVQPNEAQHAQSLLDSGVMPADATYQIVATMPQSMIDAAAAEAARALAKNELSEIDRASIRACREYIAAKLDAPAILRTKDAAAASARGRLV